MAPLRPTNGDHPPMITPTKRELLPLMMNQTHPLLKTQA